VAAENIDSTPNGTGFFNTKIPGLSDAADIQAALRLYHYGSYTYDGANTDVEEILESSIAGHLQSLVAADAAEIVNRNAAIAVETANRNTAISAHNSQTINVHGIANTASLATQQYVDTAISDAIDNSTGEYPELAGEGLVWNAVTTKFDVAPRILNTNTVITKTSSFILDAVDVGKTIVLNMSSPSNLTIPSNSSVAIPVGYQFNLLEIGLGRTTFSLGSGVTLNSKNSQMYIDGQYGKATLLKLAEDSWIVYGDIYENVSTPTPASPTPTAPTPTAPTPTAPTPTAPTPTAPTPTAPTPNAPTPTPPAPLPPAPTPTAPTPTVPTPTPPVVNYYGFCTLSNVAFGPQETSASCIDAYNAQENANGYPPIGWVCGSTPLSGTPSCGTSPTPTAPTPTAPTPTAPTPTAPTPTAPTPTAPGTVWYCTSNYTNEVGGQFEWDSNITGSVCGESAVACSTSGYPATPSIPNCAPTPTAPTPTAPTPTAPTPTAPTPTAPTPTAPTPTATVWYCTTNYTNEVGGQYTSSTNDTGSSCGDWAVACSTSGYPGTPSIPNCAPTPTAPTPTAPTPTAPTPTAPTPTAPTPTAPTPTAPTPTAPTPTAPTPTAPSPYFSPYFTPRWGSDYRLKDSIEEYRVDNSAEIISDLEIN
jgi:hypothetical protein